MLMNKVFFSYLLSTLMEHSVEHPVGNKRFGKLFLLEMQAIALYFLTTHAQGRRELSQQTMNSVQRYFPYTEETKHMIYAVGIKIVCHILKTAHPPQTAILKHFIPVICWKAPVLTIYTKIIRWSTCLTIKIEIARFCPHITSITVYTYWDIPFQNHSLRTGILMHSLHLCAKNILHEIEERHLLISLV